MKKDSVFKYGDFMVIVAVLLGGIFLYFDKEYLEDLRKRGVGVDTQRNIGTFCFNPEKYTKPEIAKLVIGCLLTPCKGLRTYPTMTLGDNIIVVVNAE